MISAPSIGGSAVPDFILPTSPNRSQRMKKQDQTAGYSRLTTPLVRENGRLVPTTWDVALDRAAEGFRRNLAANGPEALGILRGASEPQRLVIVGCHHDAWGCGASDPLAGTIVLMECARSFAELANRGIEPARTIIFGAWGAEEHGIIGSVEWCEANRDRLLRGGVAYLNLDMAAMGPRFGAASS